MVKSLLGTLLIVLVLLGGWGYRAYTDYKDKAPQGSSPTVLGFSLETIGVESDFGLPRLTTQSDMAGLGETRVELGAIVVLALAMVFAMNKLPGVLFSVSSTTFVTYFTLAAHLMVGIVLVGVGVWTAAHEHDYSFTFARYSQFLFAAALLGLSFVGMRQAVGMVRGEQKSMQWIVTMLSLLLVVVFPTIGLWADRTVQSVSKGSEFDLAQVGILPNFAVAGYPCEYGLVALSFLCILMIAFTRENYRYD